MVGDVMCDAPLPITLYQLIPPFASMAIREEPKKVYYCQRCLNHNRAEPRKNHKCDCPFAKCACFKCSLVEKRRRLNLQLHELEGDKKEADDDDVDLVGGDKDRDHRIRTKGERVPNCQKCGQHGRKSRLKGHKRVCPFRDCTCAKCLVVTERQKLMADQIKIRRRQRKDTLMNLTREHITSTLNAVNAAAAFSSPAFNFGSLSALLYGTAPLKATTPSTVLTSPTSSDTSSSYSPSLQLCSPSAAATSLAPLLMPPTPESTSPPILAVPSLPLHAAMGSMTTTLPTLPTLSTTTTTTSPTMSSSTSAFASLPMLSADHAMLLQSLLTHYRLLENKQASQEADCNVLIDVCGV